MKEITKQEIAKLIKAGFIKPSGNGGYINPKKHQPVGLVKTVHGRHYYIEDWYGDKVKTLR